MIAKITDARLLAPVAAHDHGHEWFDSSPRTLEALTLMRTITGSNYRLDKETGLLNAMIDRIGDDGLVYNLPYTADAPWRYEKNTGCPGRNYSVCSIYKANYFTTFNYTDSSLRVQDICLCFKYLLEQGFKDIYLIGLQEAGYWCMAALGALDGLNKAVLDMGFVNSLDDKWYKDNFFVPHICAAGGLETSLRVNMAGKLMLFNMEDDSRVAQSVRKIYTDMGKQEQMEILFGAL